MIAYRKRLSVWAALALGCVVATGGGAQTIAITGGKVYPVSGPPIENGTVTFDPTAEIFPFTISTVPFSIGAPLTG